MNRPVVGDQRHVESAGDLRRDLALSSFASSKTISAVQEASVVDQVHGPEARVVVVMVDVQDLRAVAAQEAHGHAVDVAAVQEDEHAVDDVGRGLVEDVGERQEAVFDRQRELLGREEHHRVLAELLQDVVHGQQRPERVSVRALVRREEEAVSREELLRHLGERVVAFRHCGRRLAHSSSSLDRRTPRSGGGVVSS